MGQQSADFSYFMGGLALMSTVISLVLCSRSYLPSSQMKILDELLLETRQIYEKSDAEDLLPNDMKLTFGARLTRLERLREQYREQCYQAITMFDQYIALLRGLSKGIMKASEGAQELRAGVVTTSQQSKRHREEQNRVITNVPIANDLRTPPPTQIINAHENEDHATQCRSTTPDSETTALAESIPPASSGQQPWYFPWHWNRIYSSFSRTANSPITDIESNIGTS